MVRPNGSIMMELYRTATGRCRPRCDHGYSAPGGGGGVRREPVVENLIDRVGLRQDAGQRGRIRLAVFFEVENSFFRSLTKRHSKGRAGLRLKARARFQQTLYFASCIDRK